MQVSESTNADAQDVRKRPRPNQFQDYRKYLRMMVRYLQHIDSRFTYRAFSRRGGFGSPSVLKNVVEGHRNMSLDSVSKFARGLELTPDEAREFDALVRYSVAGDEAEKARHLETLRNGTSPNATQVIRADQYSVYDHWSILPLLELIALPDFVEDVSWISARFRQPVGANQIRSAIEGLLKVGLIERDDDGRLRRVHSKIATPLQVNLAQVRKHNRNVLEMALQAMDSLPRDERHVSTCAVRLTQEQYQLVEKLIEEFRHRLLNIVEDTPADPLAPQEVHNVGIAVYPVTARVPAREERRGSGNQ